MYFHRLFKIEKVELLSPDKKEKVLLETIVSRQVLQWRLVVSR